MKLNMLRGQLLAGPPPPPAALSTQGNRQFGDRLKFAETGKSADLLAQLQHQLQIVYRKNQPLDLPHPIVPRVPGAQDQPAYPHGLAAQVAAQGVFVVSRKPSHRLFNQPQQAGRVPPQGQLIEAGAFVGRHGHSANFPIKFPSNQKKAKSLSAAHQPYGKVAALVAGAAATIAEAHDPRAVGIGGIGRRRPIPRSYRRGKIMGVDGW